MKLLWHIVGWIAATIVLFLLWQLVASISDASSLDGTLLQRCACLIVVIMVSGWLPAEWATSALSMSTQWSTVLTFRIGLMLEGIVCFEIARVVWTLLKRRNRLIARTTGSQL